MGEIEKGTITRSALGRLGFVGELYDVRTESLSSRSLFKTTLPENALQCRDLGRMEYEYKFTESISDYFDLLKVEAELQVGILCGLINVDGSGKFLSHERKSDKTVSCSLICKLQTVCEKFYAAWNEILEHIDLNALKDDRNTHVIVGCSWGANCLLTLESSYKSTSECENIQGRLGADLSALGKLLTATKGEGEFEKVKNFLPEDTNIQIKVIADVTPQTGWPTTVESFCMFMQEVPNLVKDLNGGKGKPLSYAMIPLSLIRKLANVECAVDSLVVNMGEGFILSTVYFLDEVATCKRKFNDLIAEMNKYLKYINCDVYKKIKNQQAELGIKESNLKQTIAEKWTSVRSGSMQMKDFIKSLEVLKSNINICEYEIFLDSCQEIYTKLFFVEHCLSQGIVYLGRDESYLDVIVKDPMAEFIVLLTSKEIYKTELGLNNVQYFLSMVSNVQEDKEKVNLTKFIVVDLDCGAKFFGSEFTAPRCVHMKGSTILNRDLYGEYQSHLNKNFAVPKSGSNAEYLTHKPGNRVPLRMVCPNFQNGICSPEVVDWFCERCKSALEYGFDEYFYCSCGTCKCSEYEFRCCNPKHGNSYCKSDDEFLKKMLSKLSPLEEMNILILGQSGVGKSTWINSIVNYLKYETLEDAEKGGVICTIPTKFTMYSKSSRHSVIIGEVSSNEETEDGKSATQSSRTYSFTWGNRFIRLIDTPGLGDTRGIAKDKENIHNVINHLRYLKNIHGICILLKAGDNRQTGLFSYCFKELLINLHKSVTKNIVFCYTNSRITRYFPGQVSVMVEKIIRSLGLEETMSLGEHNQFCLDNEAFLFLCSLTNPDIHYEPHLVESYRESWKISLMETVKMFNTIKSFDPHPLEGTTTLFSARIRILSLTIPLAEINKTVLMNVDLIQRKQNEILYSKKTVEDLVKNLTYTEVQLETEALNYPRTVCTNRKCVQYIPYKTLGFTDIEYVTHCHERCYLENVEVKTTNNVCLQYCSAMGGGKHCIKCGCGWQEHMHITFSQKRVEKQLRNKEVENDISKSESAQKKLEKFVEELELKVKEYKKEQDFILQATVKFGMFLKQHSIAVYNDSLADYLEYLIEEEEKIPHKSEMEKNLLKNLKDMLARYEKEVEVFEEVMKRAKTHEEVSIEDVLKLEKELYNLNLTGKEIKKHAEMSRNASKNMSEYMETPIRISESVSHRTSSHQKFPSLAEEQKKAPSVIDKFYKSVSRIKDTFWY